MLKRLLYLYNDGHVPFPKLGKGGLGYHLPQYKKRMHGDGVYARENDANDIEYVDDMDSENVWFYDINGNKTLLYDDDGDRLDIEPLQNKIIHEDRYYDPNNDFGRKKLNDLQEYNQYYDDEDGEEYIKRDYDDELLYDQLHHGFKDTELTSILKSLGYKNASKLTKEEKVFTLLEPNKDIRTKIKKIISENKLIGKQSEYASEQKKHGKVIEDINDVIDRELRQYLVRNKTLLLSPKDIEKLREELLGKKMSGNISVINSLQIKKVIDQFELGTYDEEKIQQNKFINEVDALKQTDSKKYPTRGEAYEELMMTRYKDELKGLTNEPTSQFTGSDQKSLYYNPDGTPIKFKTIRKDQEVMVDMSKNTLYDGGNKDTDIEFKYYPNDDVCDIQVGKFTGNGGETPYFHEVNGRWKLYNVYNNTVGWVNEHNDKELYVHAQLDDGKYKLSITDLINIDPKFRLDPETKDGKELYRIDESYIYELFDKSKDIGHKYGWVSIRKDQMKKIT
jgi:hypothetical protein